ncbi:MAG: hypothetical protein A4E58_02460 [Syntrophorhabdus sp. PtaB.Bin006]|nr:MAG: hypothetical protein A4E58_02460 [Syntrophorhabdus sp. PtaB.Bin006]
MASSIICSVPFGLPKVIVSTMASRDVREYVGTKDIVMFHCVMEKLASIIAEKLNKLPKSTYVLILTNGWSEGDRKGMPLFDLSADSVFTKD